jgi:hypothetical protein
MAEPGWMSDPSGRYEQRYFDGTQWTGHVFRGGQTLVEQPLQPVAPVPIATQAPSTRVWTAMVLGGGCLAVIAALMPWARVSLGFISVTQIGVEGDGVITLIAGALAALLGFLSLVGATSSTKAISVIALVLGLAIGGVGVYDFADVSSAEGDIVQPGAGLYLTIIAGGLVMLGSIVALKKSV